MEDVENVDFGRGETIETNYNKASAALNLFSKHSDKAISQRAKVLKESVHATIDGKIFNKKEANDRTINAVQKWL
eukprot:14487598-Ditylum_brightwellii.AAC.1